MTKRMKPAERKAEILQAAINVASRPGGWGNLTREAVAKEAECAEGLPSKYFGTMTNFKRAIMRAAISRKNLPVIAQGLADGDKVAAKVDEALKREALATLAKLAA